MLNLLEQGCRPEYAYRVSELDLHSYICGKELDEANGFTYPVPFPPGLQIGALLHYLRNLQSAFDDDGRKALWDRHSMLLRDGLLRFLRLRWKESMPKNMNISDASESLGVLFNALYELAEEIGPYQGKDRDPRLSADPAYWLHNCIKEIAAVGNFWDCLGSFVELTDDDTRDFEEKASEQERKKGEKLAGKKATRFWYGRLIKNLEAGYHVKSSTGKMGYLELLLVQGQEQAGKYSRVNRDKWKPVTKAMRRYKDASTGSGWTLTYLRRQENGDTTAFHQKYNKPKKVLTARALPLKGFQRSSENFVSEVFHM